MSIPSSFSPYSSASGSGIQNGVSLAYVSEQYSRGTPRAL